MGWKTVIGQSAGMAHRQSGIGCQDFASVLHRGHLVAGVVADGAGSAKYGAEGARQTVQRVKACIDLKQWDLDQPDWLTEAQARPFFKSVLIEVAASLTQTAQEWGCPVTDLSSTLIIFIGTPQGLIAMQVGDGFLVVGKEYGSFDLVFQPSKGEHLNETVFVTSEQAVEAMQVQVLNGSVVFICASTDGLEPVAIQYQDWRPFSKFFQPFQDCLHQLSEDEAEAYIHTFLESERLHARTSDDKALIICQYT